MRTFVTTLALLGALFASASAQQPIDPSTSSTRFGISNSATGTTGAVAATLTGQLGKFTFICGFSIQSSNPTTAITVTPSINNVVTGGLAFEYSALAAAATVPPPVPLTINFTPCLPSIAENTNIVVTLPALGAGTTGVAVQAWGYLWDRNN